MTSIPISEFFNTVFNGITDTECVFCSTFKTHPAPGDPWGYCGPSSIERRAAMGKPHAEYFCTATVRATERPRRRDEDLEYLYLLVLDDVGTKVEPNELPPSYRIETSPGNEQWGYLLEEPLKVSDGIAERLVRAVYAGDEGLTDGGGKIVGKMVRPPAGVNLKYDPIPSVELLEWEPSRFYSVDALVKAWSLDLDAVDIAPKVDAPGGLDFSGVEDEVFTWLQAEGMVLGDSTSDFIDIRCPWADDHSAGGVVAGYSPLGHGNKPHIRGFNCFHDACKDRKSGGFLQWVEDQGGPVAGALDVMAPLLQRYALVVSSNEVVDLDAPAAAAYPAVPLSHWKAAHSHVAWVGPKGREYIAHVEWLKAPNLIKLAGPLYRPEFNDRRFMEGGYAYYNTYRAPVHPSVDGSPDWFLRHMEWVVPDRGQLEMVLDWLAFKVQNPGRRAYALVMVADFNGQDTGERYGIGRSMIADAVRGVLQTGVGSVDLEDVVGSGGQSAYNEWCADAQLIVVEETKESVGDWKGDVEHYERLKSFIDPKVVRGVRIKPKYGRVRVVDLYFNMMFLTNHYDAMALPAGERRTLVVGNNTARRSREEYQEVVDALEDAGALAQLYRWFMAREVVTDMIYPPMTPEKSRMMEAGTHTLDDAWEIAAASMAGDLVTQKQLLSAMTRALNELEADELASNGAMLVRKRFKGLSYLEPGNNKSRPKINGRPTVCKILRNREAWQKVWSEHCVNHSKDASKFADEVAKNDAKNVLKMARK